MNWQKRGLYRLGFRFAFIALAIQLAIPFLLAVEIRAYTPAVQSVLFDQSLCIHDAATHPSDRSPGHDCNLAGCPLCTALAAMMALGVPGQGGIAVPLAVASTAPALGEDQRSTPPPFAHPYRSRAPPSA